MALAFRGQEDDAIKCDLEHIIRLGEGVIERHFAIPDNRQVLMSEQDLQDRIEKLVDLYLCQCDAIGETLRELARCLGSGVTTPVTRLPRKPGQMHRGYQHHKQTPSEPHPGETDHGPQAASTNP